MKLRNLIAILLLITMMLSSCSLLPEWSGGEDAPDIGEAPSGGDGDNKPNGDITDDNDPGDNTPEEKPCIPPEDITTERINITSHGGLTEAAYVEFDSFDGASDYNLYLKGGIFDNFTLLNSDIYYLQELSDSKSRADLIGLMAGEYEIKVVPVSDSGEIENSSSTVNISVKAYDRSGYAHFKYDEGVGAYNNDGTLKDDAIVIYVTEENKNTVMSTVEELSDCMFTIPGTNKQAEGIGWWLNSSQYLKSTSDTYGPDVFDLGFTAVTGERPIVIRIVGKVTVPDGLTAPNSYIQGGGGVGDKGNMARARNLKNVTIEGVGFDAEINGWGISLGGNDPTGELGRNFEIRNLIFRDYSEDAIEITGKQEGKTLISTVERIWIHNNCFYSGYYDDSEIEGSTTGDGTVDFKYGQYYTLSYNYFEGCDKTMLVGSSDDALQFNVSMHHNILYNCRQRIPLVRHANIHFYNNYILLENSSMSPIYVSSLRADCYMFSENNYYEGVRAVIDSSHSGGNGKFYGNTYLGCYLGKDIKDFTVEERTAPIESSASCVWGEISYKNFDTNSELFYYDSVNQRSDCYLTDSATARLECIKFSGSYYRTVLNQSALSTENRDKIADIDGFIDLSGGSYSSLPGVSDKGIIYTVEGKAVGKGVIVSFRLLDFATVRVDTTSASEYPIFSSAIVNSYGEVVLSGSGEALLYPGSYCLMSGANAYNTTVNSLEFIKYEGNDLISMKEKNFKETYSKIPEKIEYTEECYRLISEAIYAYDSLGYETEYSPYLLLEEYFTLGQGCVEGLISDIGGGLEDKKELIIFAIGECDTLLQKRPDINISGYDSLLEKYDSLLNGGITKTFENGIADAGGFFSITGNLKTGVPPKTYYGVTYTKAMKMESASKTSINFDSEGDSVLMIISGTAYGTIKVDGIKYTADRNGIFSIKLNAGAHTVERGDSEINVYAFILV